MLLRTYMCEYRRYEHQYKDNSPTGVHSLNNPLLFTAVSLETRTAPSQQWVRQNPLLFKTMQRCYKR